MSEKIYLNLLILCGIFYHRIVATLSDEDTIAGESSDFLVRKKRVINHLPSGRFAPRIQSVNYIVKIKEDGRGICAGAIVSRHTVITGAYCVQNQLSKYQVLSGASSDMLYNFHGVRSKVTHYGNLPHRDFDGIALMTVDPAFEYTEKTGNIQLHVGPLPVGTHVTVSGWGYLYPIQPGVERRQRLRTIYLPIMNHTECQIEYRGRFNITEKHICTFDPQQYCARNDVGAPLVFDNKLVGIHVYKGENRGFKNPDVFINLQRTDYSEWIREHILLH